MIPYERIEAGIRRAALAAVVVICAVPVVAQDGTGPVPENAEARSYGGGWDCTLGYRVDSEDCVAIDVPENAYATGRTYGSGWACRRGYDEVGGVSCEAIPVPENAFLRSSGFDWQCERGYRQDLETCVLIILPENAYLTNDPSGSGWECERGYTATTDSCVPIAVPENGYLTNANFGAEWACERGFFEIDGRCDPVALPANAFLDQDSYGPGWQCERGFEAVNDTCVAIDLPANAHLDRSGNRWRCDRSFQLSNGECVLGRQRPQIAPVRHGWHTDADRLPPALRANTADTHHRHAKRALFAVRRFGTCRLSRNATERSVGKLSRRLRQLVHADGCSGRGFHSVHRRDIPRHGTARSDSARG